MTLEHLPETLVRTPVKLAPLATTALVNLQKYHAMQATIVTPILLLPVLKARLVVQQDNLLRMMLVEIALQVKPVNNQISRLDAMKVTFALEERRPNAQIVNHYKAAMFALLENTVPIP